MAVVTLRLAQTAFTGWETSLLGAAAVAVLRFRVGAPILVLAGSVVGWFRL